VFEKGNLTKRVDVQHIWWGGKNLLLLKLRKHEGTEKRGG